MTSLEIILIFGGLVACIYLAYIEGPYDGEEKANKERKAKRTGNKGSRNRKKKN